MVRRIVGSISHLGSVGIFLVPASAQHSGGVGGICRPEPNIYWRPYWCSRNALANEIAAPEKVPPGAAFSSPSPPPMVRHWLNNWSKKTNPTKKNKNPHQQRNKQNKTKTNKQWHVIFCLWDGICKISLAANGKE